MNWRVLQGFGVKMNWGTRFYSSSAIRKQAKLFKFKISAWQKKKKLTKRYHFSL